MTVEKLREAANNVDSYACDLWNELSPVVNSENILFKEMLELSYLMRTISEQINTLAD
jgi:hypothetical protein